MKKNLNIAILFAAIASLTFLGSCSRDEPSPGVRADEVRSILTSRPWKPASVTVDGKDRTDLYPNLVVAFSAAGFTSSGGEPVWPASGTWQFTSEEATTVQRSDGTLITVEATDSQLILKLTWSKKTFGRINSVSGQHVFTMVP